MKKINICAEIGGLINGAELKGQVEAFYAPEHNFFTGIIDFTKRVETFDPLCSSSTSYVSICCSMFSKPLFGATNIVDLCDGELEAEAYYSMMPLCPNGTFGERVGNVAQKVQAKLDGETWRLNITLTGNYSGPTNIISSPGYSVYMRQFNKDTLEGIYGQTLQCADGTNMHNLVRRLYHYKTNRQMPFEEVLNYKLLKVTKQLAGEAAHIEFVSQAYYAPTEARNITHEPLPDFALKLPCRSFLVQS